MPSYIKKYYSSIDLVIKSLKSAMLKVVFFFLVFPHFEEFLR